LPQARRWDLKLLPLLRDVVAISRLLSEVNIMRPMRHLFVWLSGIALIGMGIAWADDPPPASDAKSPPAVAESAKSAAPEDQEFERYVKNFKIREKGGEKLYCREEAPLGTRMKRTVCLNEGQVRQEVAAKQDNRDEMVKKGTSRCTDGTC
jgi:hypothetical protein